MAIYHDLDNTGQEVQQRLDQVPVTQADLAEEVLARQAAVGAVQNNVDAEELRAKAAEKLNADDIDAIEEKIPSGASSSNKMATASDISSLDAAIEAILLLIPSAATSLNKLADKAFVNSSIATATATFRGTKNLVSDLNLAVDATHEQIAVALSEAVSGADNNDYAFVQVPTSSGTPTEIRVTERYKFDGTAWSYEYDLNNSGFTSDQWAAINSTITSGLVDKLNALPSNADLTAALGILTNGIAAINEKIPTAATSSNKLVDNASMQSVVSGKANISDMNTALAGKQDVISDLAAIRSGAAAGATAQLPATTLAGYNITDAYTNGQVDNLVNALQGGNIVVGPKPATGSANTIYRVPGTGSYTDWMYYNNAWIELGTFDNSGLPIRDDVSSSDLEVMDEQGNTIVEFRKGHVKTRDFDSEKVLTNDGYPTSKDLEFSDESGNVVLQVNGGHIKTQKFDSSNIQAQGSGSKVISESVFDKKLPTGVAKVYITSELLTVNGNDISPLTVNKNKVGNLTNEDVELKFESPTVNFTDYITISYQGATSLQADKKGFSIKTKAKHRFGKWREFNSFNLKGYHTDWQHMRDIMVNTIYEQILSTRQFTKDRPYKYHNALTDSYSLENTIDSDAICHIDGFPIELYINGTYWGLYSWNLKKDLNNYMLKNDDANHIFVDMQWMSSGTVDWSTVEFACPKVLIDKNGNEYDDDNPTELIDSTMAGYDSSNPLHVRTNQVKQSWVAFQSFLYSITGSTTKDTIASHLDIDDFVDVVLLYDFVYAWDSIHRNTLYVSWDKQHYSLCPYDLDCTFGFGSVNNEVNPTKNPFAYENTAWQTYTLCPWMSVLENILADDLQARYRELKNCGVFSVENIRNLCSRWNTWVGADVYKRDLARWTYNDDHSASFLDSSKRIIEFMSARIENYLDVKYNY